MQHPLGAITAGLCAFFGADHRRIQHALLVLHHALRLAEGRSCDHEILVAAALLHDVGIRPAEAKHGYNDGRLQEEYGPAEARRILEAVGFPAGKIGIVAEIIGNHHSPSRFPYPELALLTEADRLVNRQEEAEG